MKDHRRHRATSSSSGTDGNVENEVRLFNTILVDAIIEGKVLHDGKGTYELLRRKIEAEIESRGLVRTELGWVIEIFSWRRSTARSRGPQ
ncbi:MAG: hypothetical protein QXH90_07785 [Candidatus Korarchaeum sp.]